jgi:uncharacterized protein with PIN domain
MKFIADVMLGKLAKRLRLLGLDVLYEPGFQDNEIIGLSLEQDRVILTRDRGLSKRPLAARHLLIISENVHDQLLQVLNTFRPSLDPAAFLTRCSVCNELLKSTLKQEVRDLVPSYVYNRINTFLKCSCCGRIYWKGNHVRNLTLSGPTVQDARHQPGADPARKG